MKKMGIEPEGFWEDMKEKTLAIASAIVLIVALLSYLPVYATGAGTTATVLNAAPTVSSVDLTPDDAPATLGVQVINPEPATTNKTVTITATVCDLNGWDDIVNTSVAATITGPSVVEESPVSLSFDSVVNVTTIVYKGSFNMSNHSEGDYEVEVTATDFSGSTGAGSKNFTYSYSKEVTVTVAPESAFDSKGNNVTSEVKQSDGVYAAIEVWHGESYVELNFLTDIPLGATIESVIFFYKHYETVDDGVYIDVWDADGANWVRYAGNIREADTTDSQNVTSVINTEAEAENSKIRYVCYDRVGTTEYGYLDHAYLNITYSYVPDTTPPAKVTGVTVTPVSCAQLDVSWTANPESDIDHYNVYRNGNRVASPTTNSYSDTGLTANTTYNYKITAVDNSSNEGTPSDEKSGTTAADSVGPVTSDVVAEPNPTNGAETVTLNATISDSSTGNSIIAAAEYFVNATGDNGNGTAMNASDGWFDAVTEVVTADINVSDWPVGNYTLFVHGRDEAGKWGETSAVVLKVAEMPTNVMHVHSIDMSLSKRTAGKQTNIFTRATAVVTVVNTTGIVVEVATVEGYWSNATTDSDYGPTNSTGQVSLDSNEYKNAPDGTNFTFTVDSIAKDGWTYDPDANEETSGTIFVEDGYGLSSTSTGAETVGTSTSTETENKGFYDTWIAPAVQYISRLLGGGGE